MARLEFKWPHGGQKFSFDLGGILSGAEYDKAMFVAESKKYSGAADLGGHYDDWVAKCYVMRLLHVPSADQFMFITWHPFRVNSWGELCESKTVIEGLLKEKNRKRVFGVDGEATAREMIDRNVVEDVADRLWLTVLSDKQETLVISPADRALVISNRIKGGL